MFNPLCIIFLTSASFLSVQSLPSCPLSLSVDISNGTLLSNLSIFYNDVVFPKETQFLFENKTRACVCDVKACVRKCCPEGQSFTDNGCDWYENAPPLQFNRYAEPVVNSTPDIYKIYDKTCSGPDKVLLLPQEDKFYLQEDGQLYTTGLKDRMVPQDEFCYDFFDFETIPGNFSVVLCIKEDSKKAEATSMFLSIGMIISMPFLLLTFVVYALLPERNIHGKCLMSYVITLFGAYVLLVVIQFTYETINMVVCRYVGLLCYLLFMVSFFWMNVMSIDIWWAFSGMRGLSSNKRKSELLKFLMYCGYAWGVPLLLTILIAALTLSRSLPHTAWYNPGMGEDQCWFKDAISTFVYFYLPMTIIIIANVAFFVITSFKIKKIQRDTSMLRKDENKKHNLENDKQRFNLYLKLLLAMGVNWIMEIISWAINWQVEDVPKAVWYATDCCNALYGVFIFFIFVFKRNIWKMLCRRYYNFKKKPYSESGMTKMGFLSRTRGSSLNQTVTSECKSYADDTSITLTSQVA